jgi:hypothetical protein
MGTILASAIVTDLRVVLLDPTPGKTWTDAILLKSFQAALRRMASVKPDIYTVQGDVALVAGIDQQLPTGGTQLFKLLRNKASGRPIVQASESLLLEENRFALAPTNEVDVDCFAVDSRDGTRFTISPPNTGAGVAIGLYGGTPALASLATAIPIEDIHEAALKCFVLAECYRADTARQDLSKTQMHINEGTGLLGIESQSKAALSPKLGQPGGQ